MTDPAPRCDRCLHWAAYVNKDRTGECGLPEMPETVVKFQYYKRDEPGGNIWGPIADPPDIEATLVTAHDFGCNEFESKDGDGVPDVE